MHLKELDLELASPPNLKLTATVNARDPQELTILLTRMVALVKGTFANARSFSLNDIDIRSDLSDGVPSVNCYQIAFQLELT